jgi:hypothetical protein
VNPKDHYCLPLSKRLNEHELRSLIEQKKYFILHAPRQTGKTSAVLNFAKTLNAEGKYSVLYVNVEQAQASKSNYLEGMVTILEEFLNNLEDQLPTEKNVIDYLVKTLDKRKPSGSSLKTMLQYWAKHTSKPIVLFLDEIDSLIGDTLISVLRQLRSGYTNRPHSFPQSVCLIGLRDVRDYRIWSDKQQQIVLGGSAFNIKSKSLRLSDFTKKEVHNLYLQHTKATSQKFDDNAINYAFEITQGQPWLVNALAYQACFEMVTDRSTSITKEIIEQAKETLILQRDTHIDVLVDRLHEPRIRYIVDAILAGDEKTTQKVSTDDLQYARDLGLIKQKGLEIANPIYAEIIPRELTYVRQEQLIQDIAWYKNADGSLNIKKLLEAFTEFYRENSADWLADCDYKESGPHLLLMAFLQRVINGGGRIHREYALGRKRADLLVTLGKQKFVIELKVYKDKNILPEGVQQTANYMNISGATEGHLVIFDRSSTKSWDEKIYQRQEQVDAKTIYVWGM